VHAQVAATAQHTPVQHCIRSRLPTLSSSAWPQALIYFFRSSTRVEPRAAERTRARCGSHRCVAATEAGNKLKPAERFRA
jgi:hypothetical protein